MTTHESSLCPVSSLDLQSIAGCIASDLKAVLYQSINQSNQIKSNQIKSKSKSNQS